MASLLPGIRGASASGLLFARPLVISTPSRASAKLETRERTLGLAPPPHGSHRGGALGGAPPTPAARHRVAGRPGLAAVLPAWGAGWWARGGGPLSAGVAVGRRMSGGGGGGGGGALLGMCEEYVAKSNAGDVEACVAMFDGEAVYGSSTVGGHVGVEAIGNMMRGFFTKCPNVHWEVAPGGYKMADEATVEFDFVRTGVPDADGKDTRQTGTEQVQYKRDGSSGEYRICRVSVTVHDTRSV